MRLLVEASSVVAVGVNPAQNLRPEVLMGVLSNQHPDVLRGDAGITYLPEHLSVMAAQ